MGLSEMLLFTFSCSPVVPVPGLQTGWVGNALELTSTDFPWGSSSIHGNSAALPRLSWQEQTLWFNFSAVQLQHNPSLFFFNAFSHYWCHTHPSHPLPSLWSCRAHTVLPGRSVSQWNLAVFSQPAHYPGT